MATEVKWTAMWTCEAGKRSIADAADLFCASYWDRKRERSPLSGNEFTLIDGTRIYRVRLNDLVRPAQYIIERAVF